LSRGDVALSSVIYDYEYGKLAAEFQPRHHFTYQVDPALLNSAVSLHARDQRWVGIDHPHRPADPGSTPKLRVGAIASGNKVVDNADHALFARVRAAWPKLLAVEMEGAGAASAIESVRARSTIGFLMVRGISDMPHIGGDPGTEAQSPDGNKAERDLWKNYAAATAAEFTIYWIVRGWPQGAKDLLRAPYHLALFLNRLRGTGEHPVFTSYQQLFNDLWDEHVARPGCGRAELLHDLAAALAEDEEMWIDHDWFADRRALVGPLIAADILSPTGDGFRIGFRHQSLFEFVRAKAFARDGASLTGYVLARQDALFVRPTLWMTLNYLRRANPVVYAREFERLWHHPDLRRHVKHLLIDFLSQVEQPPPTTGSRPAWSRRCATARGAARCSRAVTGKEAWFGPLAGPHLSAEMRNPPEEAWDVVWVLVAAFGFGRDRCLQLMEQNWLPDEAKLPHVWQTLTHLGEWDERAVALATAVVRRTDVNQSWMWQLAQTIATGQPALAVGLVAEWLGATRRRIRSAPVSNGKRPGGTASASCSTATPSGTTSRNWPSGYRGNS